MTDDPTKEMMEELVKEVARLMHAHKDQALIIENEQNLSGEYMLKNQALEQAVSETAALIKQKDERIGELETLAAVLETRSMVDADVKSGQINHQYGIIQERNKRIADLENALRGMLDGDHLTHDYREEARRTLENGKHERS